MASVAGAVTNLSRRAATYAYDALGRRTSLTRVGSATTTWSYASNSRDWSMTHDLAGGADDVTYAFAFNPAGQAVRRDISNPAYQFALPSQAATPYVRDGLNQYDGVGGTAFAHDARGNLTSDGVRAYGYDVENRLVSVYLGGVLQVDVAYDPLGRIKRTSTPTVTEQYLWDGDRLVGTFDGSNLPTGRWLHGPGPDEPLAQLLSPRRWLLADHQSSITAETDATGALVGTPYTYDPYGRPDAAHGFAGPRFRYTGQTALVPTVPLWHYKARAYDPAVGRFLQTDPIGYEDSLNLYQYVGNDPFNGTDPSGLCPQPCWINFLRPQSGFQGLSTWEKINYASGPIGLPSYEYTTYYTLSLTAVVGAGGEVRAGAYTWHRNGTLVETGWVIAAQGSVGFNPDLASFGVSVVDGSPQSNVGITWNFSFHDIEAAGSFAEGIEGFGWSVSPSPFGITGTINLEGIHHLPHGKAWTKPEIQNWFRSMTGQGEQSDPDLSIRGCARDVPCW